MQSSDGVVAESMVARVTSAAGWVLIVMGILVLAGWRFHVHALMCIVPGMATMKANTAVGFLLSGLALVRRQARESRFYSLGVLVIGTTALSEYLLKSDWGIDQLLFRDPYSAIDPGRMSQITAVGLLLFGPALLLMNAQPRWGRKVSRALGWLVGIIGFIALLGYSYDTQALYRVRSYSSVAVHTALAFVIAAIGVQCAHPREGIVQQIHANSAGGAMLRRLLPAAVIAPFLLGLAGWLSHKHLGWGLGFSMAVVIAATTFCLVMIMLRNARHLDEKDLALRETNRTLEDRVKQRTAQLAAQINERERMQTELDAQRAQMIAASKLTSLGEMAGGLAHEINSPLNIIQARASDLQELAETGALVEPATILKATGSILRTSQRIMGVVRGLRIFARDGRADPFETVPVRAILDDTLPLCRERFAISGVRLEVSGVEGDPSMECQRVQISQVLLNLLNNAFDAVQSLPEKWVLISVADEPDYVSISVSDSGRGIPREVADKAMRPFFTTKPVGKGTGLGLSISKAIADAHHGQLRIDSRGPHTRIVLSLPKRHFVNGGDEHAHSAEQDTLIRRGRTGVA